MNILLSSKYKKDYFISIFQLLKNSSLFLNAIFNDEYLNIQGMDKSHICLFNLRLDKYWFDSYNVDGVHKICFDTNIFYSIISTKNDEQDLYIRKNEDEYLEIEFINSLNNNNSINSNDYNKYFKMNLNEYEYDEIKVHETDYECEISINSKKIDGIFSQLNNFGDDVLIECNEENINLMTQGNNGIMRIKLSYDDLQSYGIMEENEVKLCFNLININRMCLTSKLTNNIDFYLCNDNPMKIVYNLEYNFDKKDNENIQQNKVDKNEIKLKNYLIFYVAPKLIEN